MKYEYLQHNIIRHKAIYYLFLIYFSLQLRIELESVISSTATRRQFILEVSKQAFDTLILQIIVCYQDAGRGPNQPLFSTSALRK